MLCVIATSAVPSTGEKLGGTLEGYVFSQRTGDPLPFVTVMLKGTKLGTSTNDSGAFVIAGVPPGRYAVIVRLLGHKEKELEDIEIASGNTTKVVLKLDETAIPLGEIQVSADRLRRKDDMRPSVLAVAPHQAKTLPGVAEDVLRTLQTLPGVLAPNDFSSQLIVRGSGPDQNLVLMDDIEVFNPYRLYGLISMFNPETASSIELITGGFPAKYGDRLSAVLDVSNKEGDKTRGIGGSLNASVSNANLVLSGRLPTDGSYIFSARRTYYDLILGPIAKNAGLVKGDIAFPNFSDLQAKFGVTPSAEHKIIANLVFSRDAVDVVSGPERKQADSVNVADVTTNDVAGLAWHYAPSSNVLSKLMVSWYRNSGNTEFGGDFVDPSLNRELFSGGNDTSGVRLFNVSFDSRYVFKKYSLKEEVTLVHENHTLDLGSGIDFLETNLVWHFRPDSVFKAILQSRNIPFIDDFIQTKNYDRINVYIQDKMKISETFSFQPGLRFDYFGILGTSTVAPRINVLYSLDEITTMRVAWGLYFQSPGYEKLLDQNSFIDLTNAAIGTLKAENAQHLVLGFERWLNPEWQVKVETYYKKFKNVIVQEIVSGTVYTTTPVPGGNVHSPSGWTVPTATRGDSLTSDPTNGATGRSFGIEFLVEKRNSGPDSRLSGWASYALAKAQRVRDGITTPFRFDQLHTVNIVLDYVLSSWLEIGVRWKYGTNFPYTPAIGIAPRIVETKQNGSVSHTLQTDTHGNVIFDIDRGGEANRFSARLPAYHRLDIRITAKANYWDLDWTFYLDVINVYNHQNVLQYRQFINDDLTIGQTTVGMLPILPTLGFSVHF